MGLGAPDEHTQNSSTRFGLNKTFHLEKGLSHTKFSSNLPGRENKEACPFAKQTVNIRDGEQISVVDTFHVRLCALDTLTCANWHNPKLCESCPTLQNKERFLKLRGFVA